MLGVPRSPLIYLGPPASQACQGSPDSEPQKPLKGSTSCPGQREACGHTARQPPGKEEQAGRGRLSNPEPRLG